MPRKSGKNSKKCVSFQEPEKKRAKMVAQQKNVAELKELLALKTGQELSQTDHAFVDGEAAVNDYLSSGAGEDDPLANSVLDGDDQLVGDGAEQEEEESDDSSAKADEQRAEEEDVQDVSFPVPIKEALENSDNEEDAQLEDQEARTKKEPVRKPRAKPSPESLLSIIEKQREKYRNLKDTNKALEAQVLSLKNLTIRLTEENVALKDKREIPQAKFTTAPGINITVAELEQMSNQGGGCTTSMFVNMLLIKLVGVERLVKTSVTGKPCQRFVNSRNPDGTPTHPAQEKLDPEIFNFICDKVAERTAIRNGAANVLLIRSESNETKIRGMIATKIGNLKKQNKPEPVVLENSSSESEKEEKGEQK